MKKTIILVFLIAFLSTGVDGNALGLIKAKSRLIIGEIVSFEPSKNLLTVKTKKGEMNFNLNERTKIKMGKEEKGFSDLKAGEKIKVYYTIVDGKDLAELIMIKPLKKE